MLRGAIKGVTVVNCVVGIVSASVSPTGMTDSADPTVRTRGLRGAALAVNRACEWSMVGDLRCRPSDWFLFKDLHNLQTFT